MTNDIGHLLFISALCKRSIRADRAVHIIVW